MKNQETFDVYYDELGDFLEISFSLPLKTEYTEDLEEGIFVTKDRETQEIKSIGIFGFKERAREVILRRVLKQLGISIPLEISIPSD